MWAHVMMSGSLGQALHWAPCSVRSLVEDSLPPSTFAPPLSQEQSFSLSLSLSNKEILKKERILHWHHWIPGEGKKYGLKKCLKK